MNTGGTAISVLVVSFWENRTIRILLSFLVIPNLTFLILGNFIFLVRPTINLDFLLIGCVALFLGRIVTVVLLFGLLVLDLVQSLAPSFFFSMPTVFEALQDIHHLGGGYVAANILFILLFTTLTIWMVVTVWGRTHKRLKASGILLLVGFSVLALDLSFSAVPSLAEFDVAKSSLVRLQRTLSYVENAKMTEIEAHDVDSASRPFFEALGDNRKLPKNVVLVVMESFGVLLDKKVEAIQFKSLLSKELNDRYEVQVGKVRFKGSTVPAEIRELCRVGINGIGVDANALPVEKCLPLLMKRRGFEAFAIHGFPGTMFDRYRWYPDLGFDESVFLADFQRISGHSETCGSVFKGACDFQVADWIGDLLSAPESPRRFIYWLSLNGHQPVYNPPREQSKLSCDSEGLRFTSTKICGSVKINELLIRSVVSVATKGGLPKTAFVLVGDHTPTFMFSADWQKFDQENVPFIVLWPKGI